MDRPFQLGFVKALGGSQLGAHEVRVLEGCFGKVGVFKRCVVEVRFDQDGSVQISIGEVGILKLGSAQDGSSEAYAWGIDTA